MTEWIFACFFVVPACNLLAFVKMVRRDNERNRKLFYKTLLITAIVYFFLLMLNLTNEVTRQLRRNYCEERQNRNKFYCQPGYIGLTTLEDFFLLIIEIYFILVARQNWVNAKDALGDNFSNQVRDAQRVTDLQEEFYCT